MPLFRFKQNYTGNVLHVANGGYSRSFERDKEPFEVKTPAEARLLRGVAELEEVPAEAKAEADASDDSAGEDEHETAHGEEGGEEHGNQ